MDAVKELRSSINNSLKDASHYSDVANQLQGKDDYLSNVFRKIADNHLAASKELMGSLEWYLTNKHETDEE